MPSTPCLDKKLVVIGDGPDLQKLRKMAWTNVNVMGWQPNDVMKDHGAAKAFVSPVRRISASSRSKRRPVARR